MNSARLAIYMFCATQAEEKLRRDNIRDKYRGSQVCREVCVRVRRTIEELGGTMPEDLPAPEIGVKELEKRGRGQVKKGVKGSAS